VERLRSLLRARQLRSPITPGPTASGLGEIIWHRGVSSAVVRYVTETHEWPSRRSTMMSTRPQWWWITNCNYL